MRPNNLGTTAHPYYISCASLPAAEETSRRRKRADAGRKEGGRRSRRRGAGGWRRRCGKQARAHKRLKLEKQYRHDAENDLAAAEASNRAIRHGLAVALRGVAIALEQ